MVLSSYILFHSQMIVLYKHPAGEISIFSDKSEIKQESADKSELTTLRKRIQVLESNLAKYEVLKVN